MTKPDLLHPAARLLRQEADPQAVARHQLAVLEQTQKRSSWWLEPWPWATLATLALVLVIVSDASTVRFSERPSFKPLAKQQGLRFRNYYAQSWLERAQEEKLIRFSEGSAIKVKKGSRFAFRGRSPALRALSLQQGELKLKVPRRTKKRWKIDTRSFRLGALGARFSVGQDHREAWVKVLEGEVKVETFSGQEAFKLSAGDSYRHELPQKKKKLAVRTRRLQIPQEAEVRPLEDDMQMEINPATIYTDVEVSTEELDLAKCLAEHSPLAISPEVVETLSLVSEDKESPYAYFSLGVIHMDCTDEPEKALQAFKIVAQDPFTPSALKILALRRMGRLLGELSARKRQQAENCAVESSP